jgi:hypothetical protein
MSNNTASSVVFHDANEFAVYELSCHATCPVLSCLSRILVGTPIVVTGQHRRQATRKIELSDLIRLPTHQLSATVSHFASTRTLHIRFLE